MASLFRPVFVLYYDTLYCDLHGKKPDEILYPPPLDKVALAEASRSTPSSSSIPEQKRIQEEEEEGGGPHTCHEGGKPAREISAVGTIVVFPLPSPHVQQRSCAPTAH